MLQSKAAAVAVAWLRGLTGTAFLVAVAAETLVWFFMRAFMRRLDVCSEAGDGEEEEDKKAAIHAAAARKKKVEEIKKAADQFAAAQKQKEEGKKKAGTEILAQEPACVQHAASEDCPSEIQEQQTQSIDAAQQQ